ncbi:MAG TPA: phosphopantetheine-binding protein [Acetivibrio sp.]|uniref:acyl carrier protein n=1 Tax=Acetivibrio sp. TaxID=1872092 RepID=UPI002C03B196|nr:phosphopantetheine-binding protein [Acetivibrio sp.]HOM01634.1 phosphopantetheine-binding protein [Acetivibrio sp.]
MCYDEVYSKAKELIADYLRVDESEINPKTNLVDDLCADSIALVELGFRFSETFSVPMMESKPDLFVMDNIVKFILDNAEGK